MTAKIGSFFTAPVQRMGQSVNQTAASAKLLSVSRVAFGNANLNVRRLQNAQVAYSPFASMRGAMNLAMQNGRLEKVTGFEADPEKRRKITTSLKEMGFTWNPNEKAWVSRTGDLLSSEQTAKVKELVESLEKEPSAAPAAPAAEAANVQTSNRLKAKSFVESEKEMLVSLLPKGVDPEYFINSLIQALADSPYFRRSNLESARDKEAVIRACVGCAQHGMTPAANNYCYFSSRSGIMEFLLGYKGLIELARKANPGLQIDSGVVREGDEFSYTYGANSSFTLSPNSEPNAPITHAYVELFLPNNTTRFVVITKDQIEKRKACSHGSNDPSSPWKRFEREMWIKSAVREALKFVSTEPRTESGVSEEIQGALESLKTALNSQTF